MNRQREQLENTDTRLNEINENLHSSSKHIQGISVIFSSKKSLFLTKVQSLTLIIIVQSIFGSIKNYWGNRKSSDDKDKEGRAPVKSQRAVSMDATPKTRRQLHSALEHASTNIDADEHPGKEEKLMRKIYQLYI